MGKFEQNINRVLQRFPGMKTRAKRICQLAMYAASPKLKNVGKIARVMPVDKYEYFCGYYDKSPSDATGRYLLCNRVNAHM